MKININCLYFVSFFLYGYAEKEYSPYGNVPPVINGSTGDDGGGVFITEVDEICDASSGNTFFLNTLTNLRQTSSSVAILNAPTGQPNRFVVAWQSTQDGSGLGVFAKLFDVTASNEVFPFSEQILVNSVTLFDQRSPKVAALPDGGFVITYESSIVFNTSPQPRQQRVLYQIFDYNGNAIGLESPVSDETIDRQDASPAITSISGDNPGFVIAWISTTFDNQRNVIGRRALARIFSTDGAPRMRSFQANTMGDGAQSFVSVSGLTDGNFMYVWTTLPNGCLSRTINAQKFDKFGNQIGPQFPVAPYSVVDNYEPYVQGLDDDTFVVTWSSNDANGVPDINIQRFTNGMTRLGVSARVNTYTTDIQSGSVVAPRPEGGFIVLWNSFGQDGSDFGIYAKFFDANGDSESDDFRVNPIAAGAQTLPSAVVFPGNRLIVTWTQDSQSIVGRSLQCRQNCIVTEWTEWSACSEVCGSGTQNRTRSILFPPYQGGTTCPPLFEERPCNTQACPDPLCQYCFNSSCFKQIMLNLTYSEAISACSQSVCTTSSNCLANIDTMQERSFITMNFGNVDSWIESWQGDNFGDLCLSISRFGAITIPAGGCNVTRAALCEIPKPTFCSQQQPLLIN